MLAATLLWLSLGNYWVTAEANRFAPEVKQRFTKDSVPNGKHYKVVYGTDDRIDVFEATNPEHQKWARAVCLLVDASALVQIDIGVYRLLTHPLIVDGVPPCSGERFATQPTAGYCTGFVVAPDLIATAGTCITHANLDQVRFVFGFEMEDIDTPKEEFDADQVYKGIEIVANRSSNFYNFAIIRIDRPITFTEPLYLRREGRVPFGALVGIIGHPLGLPKKIAFGENTRVRLVTDDRFFKANLDSYSGNCGSPVINAETGIVEGILVGGRADFGYNTECFSSLVLPNSTTDSEIVSASGTFAGWVYGTEVKPVNDNCGNATAISEGQIISGYTVGAGGTDLSSCSDDDYADVWYFFSPQKNGFYRFGLCRSDFDTTITIFSGTCDRLTEIDCNDDGCGTRSTLCQWLDAGTSCLIRISGYGSETGDYTLTLNKVKSCQETKDGSCFNACFVTPNGICWCDEECARREDCCYNICNACTQISFCQPEDEVPCTDIPNPPQGLTAQASQTTPGRIDLQWQPSPNTTKYRIYRRNAINDNPFTLVGETTNFVFADFSSPAGVNHYEPNGCFATAFDEIGFINSESFPGCYRLTHSPGTPVEYHVSAVNDCGESLPSNTVVVSANKNNFYRSLKQTPNEVVLFASISLLVLMISNRQLKRKTVPMTKHR